MNDVAKCRGDAPCPMRDQCGRYLRPEGDRQTWLLVPECAQNQSCILFEPVEEAQQ